MRTTIRKFETGDWCVYTSKGRRHKRRLIKQTQGGRNWETMLRLFALKQKQNELDILRALAVDATVSYVGAGYNTREVAACW